MLSTGEYTIFAPTDAAFIELGDEGVAELMKDTAKLAEIIKFHVMPGIVEGDFIRGTVRPRKGHLDHRIDLRGLRADASVRRPSR
ncbi:hypothetical protein M885DRAFT_547003 [Pelagophyceae sp. CCMP2097]|nr:hypothetical protein M885DRAFT_547003 [Pelagophyceae sp. CCMP2097]